MVDGDMFRRAGGLKRGYDPRAVDRFFQQAEAAYESDQGEQLTGEQIRSVSFDLVRRGYVPAAVDAALDRLDAAFVAKERERFARENGSQAWFGYVAERATTLYGRLTRPKGKRFRPAASGTPGYDPAEVDAVLDELVAYFNNGVPLTPGHLRTVTFTVRRGHKGYDQTSVDAFLDRAVEVLQAAS